jgi:hypothetical protein
MLFLSYNTDIPAEPRALSDDELLALRGRMTAIKDDFETSPPAATSFDSHDHTAFGHSGEW